MVQWAKSPNRQMESPDCQRSARHSARFVGQSSRMQSLFAIDGLVFIFFRAAGRVRAARLRSGVGLIAAGLARFVVPGAAGPSGPAGLLLAGAHRATTAAAALLLAGLHRSAATALLRGGLIRFGILSAGIVASLGIIAFSWH